MKFSLFFEMQISRPTAASEARLFHDCAEQCVLADELGYDGVWEVEHHGLYEYAHSSAPECFLAFVAAKTRRIRLGHGITLTPYRYNHPIRIAERVATLDILSGGRVDWGSGKSSSLVEQKAFECDIPALHEQWLEALEMIPKMWREPVFQWSGKHFKIPPTQVVPKPVQKPHPPIFAACAKPGSAEAVGRLGIGALNFAIGTDVDLRAKVKGYKAAVAAAKPVGREKNDRFACTPATLVLEDDREACRHGMRGARFFLESLQRYYTAGDRPVGELDVPRDDLPPDDLEAAMQFRFAEGSQASHVIGDPVAAREAVSRFKDAGVDELILVMQMGTVPHELIMKSIRTFAEKVMPAFR
ncbi:MAG TPA: LLM class flavin-dependent oxidoreductase [Planctomycetota bacterium]|nr:LLM class flavin-dependent oxidoreductase [Planctomycetota bacterium]